jgi:hypothetical protein
MIPIMKLLTPDSPFEEMGKIDCVMWVKVHEDGKHMAERIVHGEQGTTLQWDDLKWQWYMILQSVGSIDSKPVKYYIDLHSKTNKFYSLKFVNNSVDFITNN